MRIYLAGPEVFLPDAREVIARKRALAEARGFRPVVGSTTEALSPDPEASGVEIYLRNERLMREAEVCLANLSPFRGLSADPGTVWELGFMTGLGRPCFGYTSDPRDYPVRARVWAGADLVRDAHGLLRAPDGAMVEDHAMADNLMIDGSLLVGGHRLVRDADPWAAFAACLDQAAEALRP
jgi:nucleoside 2-deoxyribosyltransferase